MSEANPEAVAKLQYQTEKRMAGDKNAKPWEKLSDSHRRERIAVAQQMMIHMTAYDPPVMDTIWMESGVSLFDGHPYVTIHTGNERGQLSPDEVREHAKHLMACADAADTDALIFRALGKDDDKEPAMILISILRDEREKGWPDRPPVPKGVD